MLSRIRPLASLVRCLSLSSFHFGRFSFPLAPNLIFPQLGWVASTFLHPLQSFLQHTICSLVALFLWQIPWTTGSRFFFGFGTSVDMPPAPSRSFVILSFWLYRSFYSLLLTMWYMLFVPFLCGRSVRAEPNFLVAISCSCTIILPWPVAVTIYIYKSKVSDHSRGWPEGSLFDSYYTKV